MNDRLLKGWSMRLLLPLLLLNVTVANQQWTVGPVMISQVLFFWPAILCAAIIVIATWRASSLWPLALVGGIIAARGIGANNADDWRYYLYAGPLHLLFLLAGSVIAMERRRRILRQMRFYFLLTVPFMLLQVGGAGDWTMALNTETTAVGDRSLAEARTARRTLFAPPEVDPVIAVGQSRPSGFMHANNALSLALLFAMALHLGRVRAPRTTRTDALLLAAMVLAMAKIVVLGFLLMILWLFVWGTKPVRQRVRRMAATTVVLYALYALLFPVLFFLHFDVYHVTYSVYIRINDFLSTLDPDNPISRWLAPMFEDTPVLVAEGDEQLRLSGYSMITGALPYLAVAVPLLFLVFRRALRTLRRAPTEMIRTSVLVMIVAVLFPAAVPIWRSPLYWFILGVGVMPLVWYFSRRPVHASRRMPSPSPTPQPGFHP